MLNTVTLGNRILSWRIALATLCFIILSYLFIDEHLAFYINEQIEGGWVMPLMPLLNVLTQLGNNFIYMITLALLLFINHFWINNKTLLWQASYLLITLFVAIVVCILLKIIFGRPRPEIFILQHIHHFNYFKLEKSYWSFPSGHATTIAVMMIGISLLYKRLTFLCLSLLLVVAATRLLLNVHYISDIVAGVYLGSILSSIGFVLVQKYRSKPKSRHPAG